MKKLPRIYVGKISKDGVIDVNPELVIPFMGGFFITSGSFKGEISVGNSQQKIDEILFPTNTLILDEGYKTQSEGPLIEWTKNQFQSMSKNGWKLIAIEDSTSVCFNYALDFNFFGGKLQTNLETMPAKKGSVKKMPYRDYPQVYDFYLIKKQQNIFLQKNHLMVLVKGTASINNQEKKGKTWLKSSKDQEIQILNKNENEEVLIFILKTIN